MATDPFDSLRLRLANQVAHRRSLGVLGLLGMANAALPDEIDAKKKRKRNKKRKNKKKRKDNTTSASTTPSSTTLAPGTCGAEGSSCGTAETICICLASPTDLDDVRCVSFAGFDPNMCLDDSACAGGKICRIDPYHEVSSCLSPCAL
jgi:hypothetical protein